jgi:hypothetical protein
VSGNAWWNGVSLGRSLGNDIGLAISWLAFMLHKILEDSITRKIKNGGSNKAFRLTFLLTCFGFDYSEAGC